jgi:hypothetical protein
MLILAISPPEAEIFAFESFAKNEKGLFLLPIAVRSQCDGYQNSGRAPDF